MTIQELLMMPVGMSPKEWEAELIRRKGINRNIRKLSEDIDFECDVLEILRDEMGSPRWMKHNNRLYRLVAKRDKLLKESEGW